MKKKLSYRDKLVELAYIYDVKEIKEYEKRRKNLTSGQIELILKKNKIIIPKDYKSNFLRDNFVKPITKIKSNFEEYKDEKIKEKNRLFRKAENFNKVRPLAEELISLKPDLVIRSFGGGKDISKFLSQHKIPILQIGFLDSMEEINRTIKNVSKALGNLSLIHI